MGKVKVLCVKEGWIASTLSDVQTFGFMCIPFYLNIFYLGNNGWLNFIATTVFLIWLFSKLFKSESVKEYSTNNIDEIIEFIEKLEDK